MKRRDVLALAALTVLGACKLLDQNTFAPSPEVTPPAPPTAATAPDLVDKRVPLLTIGFGTANPDYKDLLTYAVQQAEDRRPDVAFDVVSVAPIGGDSVTQALAASRGSDDAAQVMQTMLALGVPDTRIHLGARTEASATERLVRVYVR